MLLELHYEINSIFKRSTFAVLFFSLFKQFNEFIKLFICNNIWPQHKNHSGDSYMDSISEACERSHIAFINRKEEREKHITQNSVRNCEFV